MLNDGQQQMSHQPQPIAIDYSQINRTSVEEVARNSTTIADDNTTMTLPMLPYYPSHFMRGTAIQLASGQLKRVEKLTTEDFLLSNASLRDRNLRMDSCILLSIQPTLNDDDDDDSSVLLSFLVGEQQQLKSTEVTVEHPFFVIGRGWASCNPDRTKNVYGLQCEQLQAGDICISLVRYDNNDDSFVSPPATSMTKLNIITSPVGEFTTKKRRNSSQF